MTTTAVAIPAKLITLASPDEIEEARQFIEELIEYGDDDEAWSVGETCSIRPSSQTVAGVKIEETEAEFVCRIDRLVRALRIGQRLAFKAEVQIRVVYERKKKAIRECRLTITWPRRPLVLDLPQKPCEAKAPRGTSHSNRKADRAA
ncbi:MAG TPA: hypothetical protein VGE07_00515 [Herpetosiphonaceae bacterium]